MTVPNEPPLKPIGKSEDPSTPLWMKRIPMITGVLAGLAGFLAVRSANMSNQANYRSTIAVLHQAQSSDAWAEYQADSLKRHIDEDSIKTGGVNNPARPTLEAEIKDYRTRQDNSSILAKAQAKLRDDELADGQQKLAQKDLLDYAGVAAQLGIALASIAALTRKPVAYHVSAAVGVLALLITGYAIGQPYIWRFFHH